MLNREYEADRRHARRRGHIDVPGPYRSVAAHPRLRATFLKKAVQAVPSTHPSPSSQQAVVYRLCNSRQPRSLRPFSGGGEKGLGKE